jgi:hypothetical protein
MIAAPEKKAGHAGVHSSKARKREATDFEFILREPLSLRKGNKGAANGQDTQKA